ncbi:E3 ubiquitin-protein ligase NRDP1 [Cryptococcus neoformans Bt15]|nr:E3 ubiquitin-protein ligase NRDP1 [Cryptococcus neoformans var. grubii Bt15]
MAHEITYDYIEHVDPNLTCAICRSALVDPVSTTSCKHTFCRDCITHAISHNPQCPIDRSTLTMSSLRDTEQLVKLMLDELKVKCGADGCGTVLQRGLLLAHLRTCPKAIVTCQGGDCGLSMARQRLPHHRAYECFQRKMECRKCGTILVFKDQTTHTNIECRNETKGVCGLCDQNMGPDAHMHKWQCPLVRIPCLHSTRGCSSIIPRSDLQAHLSICPFEAFSGFFEMNDARLKSLISRAESLEEELEHMREHLKRMEGNVEAMGNMRRETSDGWRWREVGRMGLGDTPPSVTPNHSDPQTPPTIYSSPPTPTPFHPSPPPVISSTSPNISILPSGGARPDLAPHHHRSIVAPSFGSHQSYADWTFSRLSGNAGNVGWEEVINGLRTVVIQLASGLDSMERRNEVRTMTESLRAREEVGSLRAIVTTLRMQVMMEPPFRPPSFQFQEERLFSCTAESTFTARLNQQATMASSSTTDQPTSEHLSHSSDENSNRNSMFRAQSNLGGYQEVTVQVRCDENGDGFEGGASGSRRENGASGNGNTIGRSRAEMRGRPMAFPPASQEDDKVLATISRDAGVGADGANGRIMGAGERKVNFTNPIGRLIRRGPPGNGGPRL